MFVELTDRLGQDGMFGRTLDLDIQKDGITLSRRRGPWSFMWGYSFVNPEARGLGTIDVFMGKPGSMVKISSSFASLAEDDAFELQMISDTTSASEEFVKMRDEIDGRLKARGASSVPLCGLRPTSSHNPIEASVASSARPRPRRFFISSRNTKRPAGEGAAGRGDGRTLTAREARRP